MEKPESWLAIMALGSFPSQVHGSLQHVSGPWYFKTAPHPFPFQTTKRKRYCIEHTGSRGKQGRTAGYSIPLHSTSHLTLPYLRSQPLQFSPVTQPLPSIFQETTAHGLLHTRCMFKFYFFYLFIYLLWQNHFL